MVKKPWIHTTESHPIRQTLGMKHPLEYTGGAFRNMTLPPDQWEMATGKSSSCPKMNPMTTPIICVTSSPTPPITPVGPRVEKKAAWSTDAGRWPRPVRHHTNGAKYGCHVPPTPHCRLPESIRPRPLWLCRPASLACAP
jgi:hypothetical protein